MEDLNSGQFKVFAVDGEVLDYTRNTHTEISSSGGGGYIHPELGGRISAPTIESSVVKEDNFWIKTTEGREMHISLKNKNIPVRLGQKLSLIYVTPRNGESSLAALVNHSSEKYWILRSANTFITSLAKEMFIFYLMVVSCVCYFEDDIFDGLTYSLSYPIYMLDNWLSSVDGPVVYFLYVMLNDFTDSVILQVVVFSIVPYLIFKKKKRNYMARVNALHSKIKRYL